jgi:hypothetical protein
VGTFSVPREWTDRAAASRYADPDIGPLILEFEHLLALVDELERMAVAPEEEVDR